MSYVLEIEETDGTTETNEPERIIAYGNPGIGKTTFASNAPKPFFIDLDFGSKRVKAARNKKPIKSWQDLLDCVRALHDTPHKFETLVLDTADRAQVLCHEYLINAVGGKNGKPCKSIAEVAGGYGAGYTVAAEEHRRLWGELERVWRDRNMRIIVLAHSKLENVKNPSGHDYQRYSLNLDARVASMFLEVSDVVMHGAIKVSVQKDGLYDGKRAKAFGDGEARYLQCIESPTVVAKNRLGLPEKIPLSWDEFVAAASRSGTLLTDTIREKARRLNELKSGTTIVPWSEEQIKLFGSDRAKLVQLLSKIAAKLDEIELPPEEQEAAQ